MSEDDQTLLEDHWRLFVALELPSAVRDPLAAALQPMALEHADHLKFTDPVTWHITLAFLGQVHPSWADAIEDVLRQAADRHPSFEVGMGRAGRFGRGLLFVGFDDASYAAVGRLGAEVRRGLTDAGVPYDTKPLHAHLTIARQRDRRGRGVSRSRLDELEQAMGRLDAGARRWQVRTVTLVRSHLEPSGPRHEPLTRVPMASADGRETGRGGGLRS